MIKICWDVITRPCCIQHSEDATCNVCRRYHVSRYHVSRTWDDHMRDQIQPWRDVTRLTEQTQPHHCSTMRHFIFLPAGVDLSWSLASSVRVPWPALGEGLMYQLFGQTRATQDLMTPNPIPLRQIFLACFHNSKMFSLTVAHWHRCLNTRWACLCSSLSQGKFCVGSGCHKLEYYVPHVPHCARQAPKLKWEFQTFTLVPICLPLRDQSFWLWQDRTLGTFI